LYNRFISRERWLNGKHEMYNLKPVSENLKTRINNALYWGYLVEATIMVERIWKRRLPYKGTQITCNRRDIEAIFGIELTEELIEAEIFDFYGGANYSIVRKF
jgi:hypothetical protein